MEERFSLLQLWEAEKALLLYFHEINTYYDLIKGDLEGYDQEDMEILAIDIDSALTSLSDDFYIGLSETDDHRTPDDARRYVREIHDYIISNKDINFATDIVEADPRFTPVQDFMAKYARDAKKPAHSIMVMEAIKDSVYDIIAWAELQYIHQGKDIHATISSRANSAVKIITRDLDFDDTPEQTKEGLDSTKAFRNYFIKDFDVYKIAKINARINELGRKKDEPNVPHIAALVAVLYTNHVLAKTYKDTLTHIFKRLSIKEDPGAYKPAQFKRKSMKGTVPATWTEAEKFYNSL